MKPLSKSLLVLLLSLTTAAGYSQVEKPKIFGNYPSTINCSETEFIKAFLVSEGQQVNLSFSDNFKFKGTVISNIVKYDNLQSMTIKADDAANTIFHLSKQINTDNSISFVGRIMNSNAADGFQLKRENSGNYKFEKLETEKVLMECNL